jgi:heme-binding NEAT domain protein
MAKNSKATKAVIASLLATSAIVPAMAVSAEVDGTVTKSAETTAVTQTIDFKVEDATGMLAKYVPGTGTLVERNGQKYIQLNLAENVLAMIDDVVVDGKTAVYNYGSKMVLIPVSNDFKAVEATFTLTTPVGKVDVKGTLTPDPSSIKTAGETTKPVEEKKEEKVYTEGKKFESVADGTYAIQWDAYKEKVGNYTAITSHFSKDAKLVVKDGKYTVEISTSEKSADMIKGLKIGGKDATVDANGVYKVEISSISALQESSVHVVVAAANMDKWYDFGFAIETANLELPKAGTTPVKPMPEVTGTTAPLFVYKDGTNELSIMQNKYTDDEVTITETAAGYDVDVTFPEGQHLIDFKVEGATVALKSEEVEGANTVKIYTVSVKDLSTIYNATADLKVVVNGATLYEMPHTLQLQFGGKQNPFTDIVKDGHYGYIVNLYSAGIFKEADKFNPKDPLKRYQFALMLNRALDLEVPATTNFTDIAKLDAETQDAVKALNAYGIINGTTATTFGAGDGIKRQHAALMIYRLLVKNGYESTGATANFTDLPKDAEAVKAIAELNHLGIMTGYQGKVTPNAVLTRSQMAKIVNNTLNVLDGLK